MHWDNVFGNVDYLLDYVIRQVHLKFICVFSALESILHLWKFLNVLSCNSLDRVRLHQSMN